MSNQPLKGIPVGTSKFGNSVNPMKPGAPPASSKKAITSLILGLTSCVFMFVTGMVAIILGIVALSDISASQGRLKGQGTAIVGIILGALGCLWTLPVILIAMLLPAVSQVRDAARTVSAMDNVRELALGMHRYHDTHLSFPPAKNANPELSWRVHILPLIDELELYEEFHLDEPWDSPHNLSLVDRMPVNYVSPSFNLSPGKTVYVVPTSSPSNDPEARRNAAAFIDGEPGPRFPDFTDGVSNTILILQVDPEAAVTWTKPEDWQFDPDHPRRSLAQQNGDVVVVMADASLRRVSRSAPPNVLRALFTRSAGDF